MSTTVLPPTGACALALLRDGDDLAREQSEKLGGAAPIDRELEPPERVRKQAELTRWDLGKRRAAQRGMGLDLQTRARDQAGGFKVGDRSGKLEVAKSVRLEDFAVDPADVHGGDRQVELHEHVW
jgi:hypothetical protein